MTSASLRQAFATGQPIKSEPMSWAQFEKLLDDLAEAKAVTPSS